MPEARALPVLRQEQEIPSVPEPELLEREQERSLLFRAAAVEVASFAAEVVVDVAAAVESLVVRGGSVR